MQSVLGFVLQNSVSMQSQSQVIDVDKTLDLIIVLMLNSLIRN